MITLRNVNAGNSVYDYFKIPKTARGHDNNYKVVSSSILLIVVTDYFFFSFRHYLLLQPAIILPCLDYELISSITLWKLF